MSQNQNMNQNVLNDVAMQQQLLQQSAVQDQSLKQQTLYRNGNNNSGVNINPNLSNDFMDNTDGSIKKNVQQPMQPQPVQQMQPQPIQQTQQMQPQSTQSQKKTSVPPLDVPESSGTFTIDPKTTYKYMVDPSIIFVIYFLLTYPKTSVFFDKYIGKLCDDKGETTFMGVIKRAAVIVAVFMVVKIITSYLNQ